MSVSALIALLSFALVPPGNAAEEDKSEALRSIRAEIEQLEAALEEATAERWRIRHEIEYNDPDVIPLRKEARKLQRDLTEVRQELTEHLRIHHPTYVQQRRIVEEQFEALSDMRAELAVLEREVVLAERGAAAAELLSGSLPELRVEQERLHDTLPPLEKESMAAVAALEELRRTLAKEDETAAELWEMEQAYQDWFSHAQQKLQAVIAEDQRMKRFEDRRIRQVNVLQELLDREEALQNLSK